MQRRKLPAKKPGGEVCNYPVRSNADIGVIRNMMTCNNLMMECVKWLHGARGGDAAAEAQRTLLLNLGRCLSETVYGMNILLIHGARGAVLVLERATIEYYGRAKYFMEYPEHAVWAVEVERLQVRLDNDQMTEDQRTALVREIAQARKRNMMLTPEARIAAGKEPFHKVKILDMIRMALGEEAAKSYNAASLVLHGNLYSSDIFKADGAAEAMNGASLEASSGLIALANLMMTWLPRAPKGLLERLLAAEEETSRLSKRYSRAYLISTTTLQPTKESTP
jgi:hypothetical protein